MGFLEMQGPAVEMIDGQDIGEMGAIRAEAEDLPLIDGTPVGEDPELYCLADLMERKGLGPYAGGRDEPPHAWEIAPQRYGKGPDGQPVRVAGESE